MLDKLTQPDFAACLGTKFGLHCQTAAPMEVELIEATVLGGPVPTGRRQGFSLIFRAPAEFLAPQQIYRLEHAKLGSLEIFLVPIGPDASGMRYEAVFN